MKTCPKFGGIERLLSDWPNQSNPSSAELLCPHPRRNFNRRSQFNFDPFGSVDFDILDLIITENESEDDSESETNNFHCGSPPLRSNNPLINDPEFQYMKDFYVSFKSSSSSQRLSRSFSPSFISSPNKRVEGFTCGGSSHDNSKSGRVLSALA